MSSLEEENENAIWMIYHFLFEIRIFVRKWRESSYSCNDLFKIKMYSLQEQQTALSNSPCDPGEGALNLAWLIARPINSWPVNSASSIMLFAMKMEDTSEQSRPAQTITTPKHLRCSVWGGGIYSNLFKFIRTWFFLKSDSPLQFDRS